MDGSGSNFQEMLKNYHRKCDAFGVIINRDPMNRNIWGQGLQGA